jgi:aldehyde dehydrogenase (NAD+)
MPEHNRLYLNGEWTPSTGAEVIEVENPTTEQVIATVPAATAEDVDRAVDAARAAFPAWSATSIRRRAELLRGLSDQLGKRAGELAETIATEMGCPMRIATRIQAALPQTVLDSYADLIENYEFDERVGNSLVTREPAGVVGAITPWNYPLHQIVCKLAPALAAGCPIVIKPSEVAPLVAYLLMEAVDEAGIPPGVVNLVPGYGAHTGANLAAHPAVDVVSFTGSVAAGTRVAQLAAANVTRVTLELGGKSANVLLPDADVEAAVKVGVANAFLNSGQTCTAWTRMLVPAAREEEILERAAAVAATFTLGDPLSPDTRLGPVVSAAQRERVRGFIDGAVAEGARVVTGGSAVPDGFERGYYVAPTVVADVAPDSMIAQQEVFGPVLSVLSYGDEDEALAIANNSVYGLAGAVWSADQDRAVSFARQMRTGSVDVNGGRFNPLAPFGGYKKSGIGRELGRAGLEEYFELKSIQL